MSSAKLEPLPADLARSIGPYLSSQDAHTGRDTPHVTLTYACSLDSTISLEPGVQTVLSGPLTKRMTHHLRAHHDAILVGVGTVNADDPGLNCRLEGVTKQPRPVIIDPNGRWDFSTSSRLLQTAQKGGGLMPWVFGALSAKNLLQRDPMTSIGATLIEIESDSQGRFAWIDVFKKLYKMGVKSVMVEGGANVINSILEQDARRKLGGRKGLVDSMIVTYAPVMLGKGGVEVRPERAAPQQPLSRLSNVKWIPMEEDVVLCGRG